MLIWDECVCQAWVRVVSCLDVEGETRVFWLLV